MGTIWIQRLTGGLDTRRLPETSSGGTLIKAQDGHIDRGGEFEQRQAFVPTYTLPAGTIGLASSATGIFVFGNIAEPAGLPAGVSYQRLRHPDSVNIALVRIPSFDLYSGKIYVVAEFEDGSRYHYYDGVRVANWVDGRARASFTVTGGDATTPSRLTGLFINGVAAILSAVTWTTSNSHTAELIAARINADISTPEYTATSVGAQVNIIATTPGTASNSFGVVPAVTGGLVLSPASTSLENGTDTDNTFQPGEFVKTIGAKEYSLSGPNTHFSGIKAPTGWTTDYTGAGFIDMSTFTSGSETLTALAKFQQYVAVFAERVIQIWYFDPDPALNKQQQVLNNSGTASPRSVTQFGDNDVFYLDESGLRSLRARSQTLSAATTDTGVAIDSLVIKKLQELPADDRYKIIGLIEPIDGRFWLIFPDEIFVLSYFPGSKISAWSTYLPGYTVGEDGTLELREDGSFELREDGSYEEREGVVAIPFDISDAITFHRRVYVRSGDEIYVYGGLGAAPQYDAVSPEVWLPYLDAGTPARKKQLKGLDAAVEGRWKVAMGMQPTQIDVEDDICEVFETTFENDRLPADGEATHFSLRFKGVGPGPRKLSAALIHFAYKDGQKAPQGEV